MSNLDCTVKFCKKCQAETTHNASGRCKPCVRIYAAAYRAANFEKVRDYNATYRTSNLDKCKANGASWAKANPERVKAKAAAYHLANKQRLYAITAARHAANPEKNRARAAAWQKANPEKNRASSAAWAKANPEARRICDQNYHAKKRSNGGKLSKGLSIKLFRLQKGKCACCKQPLGENFHLDHIMPVHLGGPNTDGNIQLLRQQCNQQKSGKHPVDFMQSRGFLL